MNYNHRVLNYFKIALKDQALLFKFMCANR